MFGRIIYISDSTAHIANAGGEAASNDLMNLHIVFEDNDQRILGEITEINAEVIKVKFLGEFLQNRYVNGVLRKPKLTSKIRIINTQELVELVGTYTDKSFVLGESAIYKGFKICPDINELFSNRIGSSSCHIF